MVTIADNKIGVSSSNANLADFYEARVLSATDYYAFGMSMKERSFQAESYRYGFNGKENDTDWEVQDYGFRIYKPELGKFLSVDPLTQSYPELTPYQFASNTPIRAVDLDGLEAEFRGGVVMNFSNKGLNLSTYASVSYKSGFAMPAMTWSANFSLGELGTSPLGKSLYYQAFSPSLTLGGGESDPIPVNTFPSVTGTGVNNTYKYSVTVGQNFIESTGITASGKSRDQRTGFLGFRIGQFYGGHSNDTKSTLGDGGDSFWSANVQAGYRLDNNYRINLNVDMYYGKSNEKVKEYRGDFLYTDTRMKNPREIYYDKQNFVDMSFNDATTSLQLVVPTQAGEVSTAIGFQGRSAMWFSNWIHNRQKFHHLYVPYNTKPYIRVGVNPAPATQSSQ